MVVGNGEPERKELYQAVLIDGHELFEFGGKYERRRVSKIDEAEKPVGPYFSIEHGCDFARIVVAVATESITRGDGLGETEIYFLEEIGSGPAVPIEFGKHQGVKGIVHGRGDLRRDDSVTLGVDDEDTGGGIEFLEILRDSLLFGAFSAAIFGGSVRAIFGLGL